MPIRVQCQCGQSLNVPDNLAGKSGKCPKCAGVIKIPGKAGTPSAQSAAAAKKPTAKKPSPKPTATPKAAPAQTFGGIGDLLDDVGLTKKSGRYCPNCDTSVAEGTAFCVKCGFNIETGQRLAAHQTEADRAEFENAHLNEAAAMMRREAATEKRTLNAGLPWWVLMNVLVGGIMAVTVGVIYVDGNLTSLQPRNSIPGWIQRAPVGYTLLGLMAGIATVTSIFAHFAVVAAAFQEKMLYGWLGLFVPLYAFIFGMTRFKKIRGVALAYLICVLVAAPLLVYLSTNVPVLPADKPT